MGKKKSERKDYKDSYSLESQIGTQRVVENDVEEEHMGAHIIFSPKRVCAYDIEPNVVGPEEISKYK